MACIRKVVDASWWADGRWQILEKWKVKDLRIVVDDRCRENQRMFLLSGIERE